MIFGTFASAIALLFIGITTNFAVAVVMLVVWAASFAVVGPIRQAYLNKLIPSEQRATVLSFDALLGSSGAVLSQPGLGKVADVWSYSTAYIVTAVISILAMPFVLLAKRERAEADNIQTED